MNKKNQSIHELFKKVQSGVIHIEYSDKDKVVASGSAFIANGYLITNNHVLEGPTESTVKLSWQPKYKNKDLIEVEYPFSKFSDALKAGSDENNYDYAILDIPELRQSALFNFSIKSSKDTHIGDDALILGFPLEHKNLVCHKGIVSSIYNNSITDII